jgi:hypothetical protein
MRLHSKIFYLLMNLVIFMILLWILLYLNTYINTFFIPDELRWENGHLREDLTSFMFAQLSIILIEIVLLVFLVSKLNNFYLKKLNMSNRQTIVNWTSTIIFVSLTIIACLSLVSFY